MAAALIWGLAFIAQRLSIGHMGTFTFNGLRFALGALSLAPFILWQSSKARKKSGPDTDLPVAGDDSQAQHVPPHISPRHAWKQSLVPGLVCGLMLFSGVTLQQIGLIWTSVGKAAFLTSFYIILVPLAGIFVGRKPGVPVVLGAVLAMGGIYVLSFAASISSAQAGGAMAFDLASLNPGDLLMLAGALFWTGHILAVDRFAPRTDALRLSVMQFLVCSVISLVLAFIFEKPAWSQVEDTLIPLLYASVLSVGVAYTLQVIGQRNMAPGPAALIMCLETVFATLGGWLILGETLGTAELAGCLMMLGGIFLSKVRELFPSPKAGSALG